MKTLANLMDSHPASKTSILIPKGPELTYREYAESVERTSDLLTGYGVQKGRAISIVLGNGLDFMITFLAATRSGAIAAPLNPAYTCLLYTSPSPRD